MSSRQAHPMHLLPCARGGRAGRWAHGNCRPRTPRAPATTWAVRARQNDAMIRGMGAYTPEGSLAVDTQHALHVTSLEGEPATKVRHDLAGLVSDASGRADSFVWVGLINPSKAELSLVADAFSLESLQVEDAANPHQRAKFDVDDDGRTFALFKILGYDESTSEVTTGQVSVFVGPAYAVTVRHGVHGDLAGVRERIEASSTLRSHGSISVLYAVLDVVVDGYIAVMDEVVNDVDEVETEVFSTRPVSEITRRIYDLKRENMEARRAVSPLVPAAHRFASESAPEVPEDLRPYFRDIGEHILRVSESVETVDSLLMTMLMASTALQDLQQNKDMRKISAYAAMGVVPTVIAGIYGMNFTHMPELDWELGYPLALGLMGLVVFLLYRAFKRSGWL